MFAYAIDMFSDNSKDLLYVPVYVHVQITTIVLVRLQCAICDCIVQTAQTYKIRGSK